MTARGEAELLARALVHAFSEAERWEHAHLVAAGAPVLGRWPRDRRADRARADREAFVGRVADAALARWSRPPLDAPSAAADELVPIVLRAAPPRLERPVAVHVPAGRVAAVRDPFGVGLPETVTSLGRWCADASGDERFADPGGLAWFADRRGLAAQGGDADGPLLHHRTRWIAKANGSARLLEAPKPSLKRVQRALLAELRRIPTHAAAHGFVRGASAVTAAAPHVGRAVVVHLDLEDFFASIPASRVRGVLRMAGLTEPVAEVVTGLVTVRTPHAVLRAAPRVGTDAHRRLLARLRTRHLAQGAPTSPLLANLVAWYLDARLAGLARARGATYTRYADDLVFSGDERLARGRGVDSLLDTVAAIVREEGFTLHPDKLRIARAGRRQRVTGIVVNERLSIPRRDLDALRAALHDAAVNGPAAANRHGHPDLRAHLAGRIAWVHAVDPVKAARLRDRFDDIAWEAAHEGP